MKKALKITSNILIVSLLIVTVSLFILRLSGKNMEKAPVHLYEIMTGSMEETLHEPVYEGGKKKRSGDIVIVYNKAFDKLKEGDIISFKYDIDGDGSKEIVTHRIIRIEGSYVVARGDAAKMESDTQVVTRETYVGAVLFNHKAYLITWLYRILSTVWGFIVLVAVPLVYLIVRETIELIRVATKAEDEETNNENAESKTVVLNGVTYTEEQIQQFIKEKEERKAKENEKEKRS